MPRTSMLLAGQALLMQVSHPVIGPGVRDFDVFAEDPWGRLDRTLVSLQTQLFGGEAAFAEATRLRELHAKIKGIGFHGERYSALQPEAYAYVPMTNFDAFVRLKAEFGKPLTIQQQRRIWAEHRQTALVLGVKDHHLPADVEDVYAHLAEMIANRLENNTTVQTLLETLTLKDVGPPLDWFPEPIWNALKPFGRTILHDASIGTMSPEFRDKFGLSWSAADEAKLRAMAAAIRKASPLVPDKLMHYPLAYKAMQESREHRKVTQ